MGRKAEGRSAKGRAHENGKPRPSWVDKAGVALALVSVIVAIIAIVIQRSSSSADDGPAKLSLVDLRVRDARWGPRPHSTVEVALHNTGGHLAVIDGARIDVLHVYELPRCATQGDLPSSNTYGVALPIDAKPGTVVKPPLHQQIGADEADRFEIALSAKWPHGRTTGTVYLFELRLSLLTDAPERNVPVGKVLVSLPFYPDPGQYYWVAETPKVIHNFMIASPAYVEELRRFSMECWRANTTTLRRALATKVVWSGGLAETRKNLVSPTFAALE